jgi:hypothetical protein
LNGFLRIQTHENGVWRSGCDHNDSSAGRAEASFA